jgi:hypothetical protein
MENPPSRSSFVTALAWIFIALAGFTSLISLLQTIMMRVMFRSEAMSAVLHDTSEGPPMPPLVTFLFGHFQWIPAFFLGISILTLIAAIALLRRHNWGRLVFIGVMAIGIAWEVGSLALMPFVFSSFTDLPDNMPPDLREQLSLMPKLVFGFSGLIVIVMTVLFAWIIKKLVSADIKREFARK